MATTLVIKYVDRTYGMGVYVPDHMNVFQQVAKEDDGAALQDIITEIGKAVETLFPGQYTVNATTRKKTQIDKVDRRTAQLLAQGYADGGYQWSLSYDARMLYLSCLNLGGLLSTQTFETLDGMNTRTLGLLTTPTMQNFAKNALNYATGVINVGTNLKDQIRAATGANDDALAAALTGIVDTR